jgi:hypothetical protein
MSMFEQQIAPQTQRIAALERSEAALAKRAEDATRQSAGVRKSVERLAGQFPEVLVSDPLDGKWVLKPVPAPLLRLWAARRMVIVVIECPVLARATTELSTELASLRTQTAALEQRAAAARRSRAGASSAERRWTGWRDFFRSLAQPAGATAMASIGIGDALKGVVKLGESGRRLQEQHMEIQTCAAKWQQLQQQLGALEAESR